MHVCRSKEVWSIVPTFWLGRSLQNIRANPLPFDWHSSKSAGRQGGTLSAHIILLWKTIGLAAPAASLQDDARCRAHREERDRVLLRVLVHDLERRAATWRRGGGRYGGGSRGNLEIQFWSLITEMLNHSWPFFSQVTCIFVFLYPSPIPATLKQKVQQWPEKESDITQVVVHLILWVRRRHGSLRSGKSDLLEERDRCPNDVTSSAG